MLAFDHPTHYAGANAPYAALKICLPSGQRDAPPYSGFESLLFNRVRQLRLASFSGAPFTFTLGVIMSDATSLAACNEAVRNVVGLIAARNYRELQHLTAGVRLTAGQIESAVRDYGRTIVPPPDEGLRLIDYVAVQNARLPTCSAYVSLFTQEEGRSDLSIDLTLVESEPSLFTIELNDVRVL